MERKKEKIITIILPFIFIIGFIVLKTNTNFFLSLLPSFCGFYMITGKQCFACGNTRSVLSILRGDIISAIKFNPAIPILLLLTILLYIEFFIYSFFGKKVKIIPRNAVFWVIFSVVLLSYYILRNL
ncbi:MAG: DUF2752 domain-containing protein [Oscillospiraceae bacterium]|nr:DUF2752 domain-containing protein [Oscillospiraceae bacterium]